MVSIHTVPEVWCISSDYEKVNAFEGMWCGTGLLLPTNSAWLYDHLKPSFTRVQFRPDISYILNIIKLI